MSEKVKLPRKIADWIEKHLGEGATKDGLLFDAFRSPVEKILFESHDITPDMLGVALYCGYEVELTNDERLKKQYDLWGRDAQLIPENVLRYNGMRIGMCDTLNILGIRIEGVNA